MGRGRAKAKQTKVARELKYRTFDTDLGALERELKGSESEMDGGNGQERPGSRGQSDEGDVGDWEAGEHGDSDHEAGDRRRE